MSREPVRAYIDGPGEFLVAVVGEASYQPALEDICGGRTDASADHYVEAILVLEDTNPFDRNAVRVDVDGVTVGYLSRDDAVQYRQRLVEAGYPRLVGICRAHIRGGWERRGDRGHFGVWLDLPYNP